MINKFTVNDWKVIEEGFDPQTNRFSESIFSLGNEHMGLRGFFEEDYSGDKLQGTYVAGIFYPDKTRVGWWKNGYPEFFAKVLNSTNWIGIGVIVNGKILDLAKCKITNFKRELNMKEGKLTRSFIWNDEDGNETSFFFSRFLSMSQNNLACISIQVKPLNYFGEITFFPYLDGDVTNEDANYEEKFWEEVNKSIIPEQALLVMRTKKSNFLLATATCSKNFIEGIEVFPEKKIVIGEKLLGHKIKFSVKQGQAVEIQKFVSVCTSRDYTEDILASITLDKLQMASKQGYYELFNEHIREMALKWEENDIIIEGDPQAQQGIRYNIFQLNQTYTGKDPRLNIGPKGFTGEKYGGGTYWDTEAFCFPFYLYTNEEVARNLLYYRYLHLEKAKENAKILGLRGALYPMVTMDGIECHNEWEITFEEIHRNAAIVYAIYNYTNYTGNHSYLHQYGIEVMVEISRFWADRVNYNPRKEKYMILGVTGPNEYENNVNNNWYTNTMAAWNLEYTLESLNEIKLVNPERYQELLTKFDLTDLELSKWREIIIKMYYPYNEELGVFEQNDLYRDKEQILVKDLAPEELPLNKHWSWDRILRSCFIKQADVIQGIYFLPDRFDLESMRRNFDFYEPRTIHESSLSPSIHSIVASWIGYRDKAYELYLRTARLDLNNYNDDTEEGVHLTSMAGSWAAIVQGFAGTMVRNNRLQLKPFVPEKWNWYSFKINFRSRKLKIRIAKDQVIIEQISGEPLDVNLFDREYQTQPGRELHL